MFVHIRVYLMKNQTARDADCRRLSTRLLSAKIFFPISQDRRMPVAAPT